MKLIPQNQFYSMFFKGLATSFCLSLAWSLAAGLSNPLSAEPDRIVRIDLATR